jgi:hypothetical protein
MALYKVVVVAENGQPLKGVTVAAYSLANYPNIVSRQNTDKAGQAAFSVAGPVYFDAFTRRGVSFRDRSYAGKVEIQVVCIGAGAIYDYVVDSGGFGTHTTVRAMVADFLAEVATSGDIIRSCWLAKDDTDRNIDISTTTASSPLGMLVIDGAGGPGDDRTSAIYQRASLIMTTAGAVNGDAYFKCVNRRLPRLIFRNIGIKNQSSVANTHFFNFTYNAAGTALPPMSFSNVEFFMLNSNTRVLTNGNSLDWGTVSFTGCRGVVGYLTDGSIATLNYDSCDMTMQAISVISDADPLYLTNSKINTKTSLFTPANGNVFNGVFMQNLDIIHEGAGVCVSTASAQANQPEIVIVGVRYTQTLATASFGLFDSSATASGSRTDTIFIDGLWMRNTAAGVAGTALTITGSWDKVSLGVIDSWNFTTTSTYPSGTTSGISHSTLLNLTNDDHTQYLRADGTRLLTANWNPGAFTLSGFLWAARPSDLEVGDASFRLGLGIDVAAATTNEGNTAVGGSSSVDTAASTTTVTKVTLTGGTYTSVSVYTTAGGAAAKGHAVLYDSGLNRLAVGTTDVSLVDSAFTVLPFASPVSLAAGTYYIGITQPASGHNAFLFFNAGAAADGEKLGNPDSNPLTGATANTNKYSMYITGYLLSHGPRIEFDTNDYFDYDRTNNKLSFAIGGANKLELDTGLRTTLYLRAGSLSAPLNTGAGDATFTTLTVGTETTRGSTTGYAANVTYAATDTASGAKIAFAASLQTDPAGSSGSEFRAFNMSIVTPSTNTQNFTQIHEAIFAFNQLDGTGNYTATLFGGQIGVLGVGYAPGSGAANGGTISAATGLVGIGINTGTAATGKTLTLGRGFYAPNPSAIGAVTVGTYVGMDVAALTAFTVGSGRIGLRNADTTVFTPTAQQSIAVSAAISASATAVQVSTTTAADMTAVPTIADGVDGQVLIVVNTGANTFQLQDDSSLSGSNLRLSAAKVSLGTRDSIMLMYSASIGDWIQIGQTNVL